MRHYKAVIFDLDGVICHTDAYHYLAWKQIADELNIPFDEAVNNRLRGVSRMESLSIILEASGRDFSEEERLALAERKNSAYVALLDRMGPGDLSEEVYQVLVEMRGRGLKLAIGSSSKNARRILQRIELGGFFDVISDGNNISRSKPDPEVFLCAAEMLALAPEVCLVVEDAEAGILAARAGGFDSAAIGDAVNCKLATYTLGGFSDLLMYVGHFTPNGTCVPLTER